MAARDLPALLYSPGEIARMTSISRSRVYELLAAGEIRSIEVGRLRRVPAAWLEEWLNTQMEQEGGDSNESTAAAAAGRPRLGPRARRT